MIIAGAGMAGLIAANYFHHRRPIIWEMQSELPHNHAALLRFKTDVVAEKVGIPFRKVKVNKALVHVTDFVDNPNPYVCNQYSLKVTGKVLGRSVWDLEDDYRYIAPNDFIQRLAMGAEIYYDKEFSPGDTHDPVISTVPMPIMMKKIGWQTESYFHKRSIYALTCTLSGDIDVYQTIYFSSLGCPYYRASIVGNRFIVEFVDYIGKEDEDKIIDEVLDFFGIPIGLCEYQDKQFKLQEYGKIVPIDEDERKEFMYTLTRDYNIYSLGRFATWRQILLDDLIKDLDVINSLMSAEGRRSLYNQRIISAS